MLKVAALVDRLPDDPRWKGGMIWQTLLDLAQSEYEVLAIGPGLNGVESLRHSNLRIAHSLSSWGLSQIVNLLTTLLAFQPDVIHVFAPRKPKHKWAPQIWPWLTSYASLQPHIRRYFTGYDTHDSGPFIRQWAQRSINITPHSAIAPEPYHDLEGFDWLIPAPVDEWVSPREGIAWLTDQLTLMPHTHAAIIGGWGGADTDMRRWGWERLGRHALRIHMLPALGLAQSVALIKQSRHVVRQWLNPGDWKARALDQLVEPSFQVQNELTRLYSKQLFVLG